jgi:hypothetical protein
MRAKIHTLVFLGFTGFTAALPLAMTGCIVDNSTRTQCDNPLVLSWSIDDNLGSAISCPGAGAGYVRVTAANVVTDFPCGSYAGTTYDVPGGTYVVDVQLLDTGRSVVLSEAAATWSIPNCGGLDLGHVDFCIGAACPP